jgi:endonuclease YncB( thermonuclease family)
VAVFLIMFMLLGVPTLLPRTAATDWEIDAVGIAYHVVDGDTLDVDSVGRVRLADINAPEIGQPGALEATDFVVSLVFNKTVYLDIDDIYGADVYGRTIAVLYARYNATYLINVNKALLDSGLAVLDDFPNEFDPGSWSRYVNYPLPAPPSAAATSSMLLWAGVAAAAGGAAFVLVYVVLRRRAI